VLLFAGNSTWAGTRDEVSRVVFTFRIRRRPLYYIANLIIPCCLLSFIAVVTFVLPPSCSDRLTLSMHIIGSRALSFSDHYCWSTCRNVLLSFCLSTVSNTKKTLDCDQSNYSLRIVFSHIPIDLGQTGISAIRSADLENPTVEPNMKWIGRPLAEIWPFEISQM